MRVISKKRLLDFWTRHPDAEQALRAWYDEVRVAKWQGPQDIKNRFPTASFLANNRVVFNIRGNKYRLIVAVVYVQASLFIKFVGTHAEYDRLDPLSVE